MRINYGGLIMDIIMVIAIIFLVIGGVSYRSELNQCKTQQNNSCYQIRCPCDEVNGSQQPPCFGYTKRPGPQSGQWYCSSAPKTLVDNNGNQIT